MFPSLAAAKISSLAPQPSVSLRPVHQSWRASESTPQASARHHDSREGEPAPFCTHPLCVVSTTAVVHPRYTGDGFLAGLMRVRCIVALLAVTSGFCSDDQRTRGAIVASSRRRKQATAGLEIEHKRVTHTHTPRQTGTRHVRNQNKIVLKTSSVLTPAPPTWC